MSITKLYNENLANPALPYFEINGIRMPTPSTFSWIAPAQIGINGAGRQRLYPFWGITLGWDTLSENEYAFLYTNWQGAISGTVNVLLPITYGNTFGLPYWDNTITGSLRNWTYYNVLIDQPTAQSTVENIALTNIKMTIRRIVGNTFPAQPHI
jgi:hypothetical protein